LSIHSSNNAPDIAKKKGVILHGVEGKTRRVVEMFEAAGKQSGKEISGIFLYSTQGPFRRGKLEVIDIRSPLFVLLVEVT
jgi:hypothetical protein